MDFGLFLAYFALGIMAVSPIYYGSFASVKWPKKAKKINSSSPHETESSSEDENSTESLSTEDAYLFPIFGSGVLFSLYLVFKLLNRDYVNYLVTAYFSLLGIIAITTLGVYIVKNYTKIKVTSYKFTLSKKSKEIYKANFSLIHFGSLIFSFILTGYYIATKNWIASNVFGLAFAFNGIQMLSLDSFKTGMILLSGLFFYDVFWVFGTEVMVTVAKSFDAPIKVVWPKQIFGLGPDEPLQFTMLGLGDIVVPGIYVALCLRFDHYLYIKKNPNASRHSLFQTTYFNSCFTAYILGLLTTILVMHTFKAAQPALLYLSPACIFSVLITGLIKGQLKELFNYSSDSDEVKKNKKAVEEEKKKKKNSKKKESETSPSDKALKIKKETSDETTEDDDKDKSVVVSATEEDYVEIEPSGTSSSVPTGGKSRKSKKSSKKKTG
ncbi:hypothetical protein G9A89_009121 [Geosiphon pyriformis]|nr:hypothetical protein G9A89_009121 [Geosiphon pyriformis]